LKQCSLCKKEKPLSEFPWKNKNKGIKHRRCKPCNREYNRNYYHTSGEKTKQIKRVKQRKLKIKEQYKEWKTQQKCSICDENAPECLDLHHKNPEEKDFNISEYGTAVGSWRRLQKELDKCVVLCSNCHRKVHSGRLKLPVPTSVF
jgi:hypothetical protein